MQLRYLLIMGVLLIASGCATMKLDSNPNRGLLQQSPQVFQPSFHATQPSFELTQPSFAVSQPPLVAKPLEQRHDFEFIWPVKRGNVSSFYGDRKRDYHEGIDIHTRRGTPVYAAKEGTVIYSSQQISGYGNMIVIKHPDDMATVYAHNQKNLVTRGMDVTQGQLIAFVGATGKATGPHLHFEIRKHQLPQDPLEYLPKIHRGSRLKMRKMRD